MYQAMYSPISDPVLHDLSVSRESVDRALNVMVNLVEVLVSGESASSAGCVEQDDNPGASFADNVATGVDREALCFEIRTGSTSGRKVWVRWNCISMPDQGNVGGGEISCMEPSETCSLMKDVGVARLLASLGTCLICGSSLGHVVMTSWGFVVHFDLVVLVPASESRCPSRFCGVTSSTDEAGISFGQGGTQVEGASSGLDVQVA